MEIKRCVRCGSFFETLNEVCDNCIAKDNKDLGKLKIYLSGYGYSDTLTKREVSSNTGITMKNLNRFLLGEEFSEFNITEGLEEVKNPQIKA